MGIAKLYAIIDRETLDRQDVGVGKFARELRESGVRLVQYRDKVNGLQEVLRAAEEISRAFEGVGATLILNDRADLASLVGWGVHVGQGDLSVEDARLVLGAGERRERGGFANVAVGVSTHTELQVKLVSATGADYVAIGPVFGTVTKKDAAPVVGLEGVRAARALTKKPLVAIGGITLANCRSVIDAGADSVAVISGVFVDGRNVRDVVQDFLEILR